MMLFDRKGHHKGTKRRSEEVQTLFTVSSFTYHA